MAEPKTSPRRVVAALRRAEAVKLRIRGFKYEQIKEQLGYTTRGAAVQDVQRALAANVGEATDELRQLEVMRLDDMWREVLAVLERQHITVSNGRVVLDPTTAQPLIDDAPVLAAVGRLLDIQARRAKLVGLDAAKQVELSLDAINAEIEKVNDELGRAQQPAGSEDGEAAGTETPEG